MTASASCATPPPWHNWHNGSLAIIDRIVAESPELSPARLSRISAITDLVPVDPPRANAQTNCKCKVSTGFPPGREPRICTGCPARWRVGVPPGKEELRKTAETMACRKTDCQ